MHFYIIVLTELEGLTLMSIEGALMICVIGVILLIPWRSPPEEEGHSGEANASAQDEHHLSPETTSDQDPNPLSSNSTEKERVPEGTTSDDVPPSSPPWNSFSDSHGSDRSESPSSPPPSTASIGPVTNPITTYVIPGYFAPKLQRFVRCQ